MNAPQNATSPAKPAAFPDSWITGLFDRMAAMYGSRFADLWRGTDPAKVKAMWAEKLAGFSDKPKAIKEALDALDDKPFPPTLPEFLSLCRQAAARHGAALPALPYRMTAEEIERNRQRSEAMAKKAGQGCDPVFWARHPRSSAAMAMILEAAKASPAIANAVADLQEAGICSSDGRLLKRWDGVAFVTA